MEIDLEKNRDQLIKEILKDQNVKKIVMDYNINRSLLDKNLNIILAYVLRKKKCQNCIGLHTCKQLYEGYAPVLSYDEVKFDLNYEPCPYLQKKKQIDEKQLYEGYAPVLSYDEVKFDLNYEPCPYLQKKKQIDEKQLYEGYAPVLSYDEVKFDLNYEPCPYLQKKKQIDEKQKNLQLIACSFQNFNFDDIYVNVNRKEILNKIKTCIDKYEKKLATKGLYIHGNYGCGKTFLLAYLAKTLAENNHKVIFAYYPDLARMLRSAIYSGSIEDMIEQLKMVEVLILDDFGGETLTGYLRDEVLGAILQERMTNNRLTFMSSNLDQELLLAHLKESNRDIDDLRASRIYERIRTLMEFVKLVDEDYRN